MARPQSESDFPGKGRWLDRNQSLSAAKRRKQVGVSITACRGPLRPASGGPSCSVQSLHIRQNRWSAFVVRQAAAVHTRQLLFGPLIVFRGMKQLAARTPTGGTDQRSVFSHTSECYLIIYISIELLLIMYFIIFTELLSPLQSDVTKWDDSEDTLISLFIKERNSGFDSESFSFSVFLHLVLKHKIKK